MPFMVGGLAVLEGPDRERGPEESGKDVRKPKETPSDSL